MTPHGFLMTGHKEMMAGTFEPEQTQITRAMMARNDVFINIGANVGYYVCHAVQLGLHVVAIEPFAANLQLLIRNIRANDAESVVEVLPVAVADRTGIAELFGFGTGASLIPGWAGASVSDSQLTPVLTLDALLGERFVGKNCLVLMDIEGAEELVLKGASQLIAQSPRPTWIVEISFGTHLGAAVSDRTIATFAKFFDTRYRCWTCDAQQRLITAADVVAGSLELDPFGCHNFVFADNFPF